MKWGRVWALLPMAGAVLLSSLYSRAHAVRPATVGAVPSAVRIALIGNPTTLDPALATTPAETAITDNVFPPLLEPAGAGAVTPGLAKVGAVSPTSITLILRAARFIDGRPVTASAAAAALARPLRERAATAEGLLAPVVGSARVVRGQSRTLAGVAALGSRQLVIQLKQPLGAAFLPTLANPALGLVEPGAMSQGGPYWQLQNLEGAGGYRLISWQAGQGLSFQRVGPGTGAQKIDLTVFSHWRSAEESFGNGLVGAVPVPPADLTQVPSGLRDRLHGLPEPGRLSWYGPWASRGLPAWLASSSPAAWVQQAFGGAVAPLVRAWPWPAAGNPATEVVWVSTQDALALQLGQALVRLSHGRVVLHPASPQAIRAGVQRGMVPSYLGSQDWYGTGQGQAVPLVRRTAFWLLAPSLAKGAAVFADGNLRWSSLP